MPELPNALQTGSTDALPGAASALRGERRTVFGAGGVRDASYKCMKNEADAYEWVLDLKIYGLPAFPSVNQVGGQTVYGNYAAVLSTEAAAQIRFPAGRIKRLSLQVSTNALGGASTLTLMVNGVADGTFVINIGAGVTGHFTVTGNKIISEGDLVCVKCALGGLVTEAFHFRGGLFEIEV